jgi:hypothetical protein
MCVRLGGLVRPNRKRADARATDGTGAALASEPGHTYADQLKAGPRRAGQYKWYGQAARPPDRAAERRQPVAEAVSNPKKCYALPGGPEDMAGRERPAVCAVSRETDSTWGVCGNMSTGRQRTSS